MLLLLSFPLHCCVQTESIILPDDSDVLGEYVGSYTVKGKPVIVLDTRGIVPDFIMALKIENGLSVRMSTREPKTL
jgi:hypothetical protein